MELEQELEHPPDPRPHDQVKCLFFILFLFVLFEEASKLQAPKLLRSFSASELLRSFSASELACLLLAAYKSSLVDASLPGYPSMRLGKPVCEADEVDQRSAPFHPDSP